MRLEPGEYTLVEFLRPQLFPFLKIPIDGQFVKLLEPGIKTEDMADVNMGNEGGSQPASLLKRGCNRRDGRIEAEVLAFHSMSWRTGGSKNGSHGGEGPGSRRMRSLKTDRIILYKTLQLRGRLAEVTVTGEVIGAQCIYPDQDYASRWRNSGAGRQVQPVTLKVKRDAGRSNQYCECNDGSNSFHDNRSNLQQDKAALLISPGGLAASGRSALLHSSSFIPTESRWSNSWKRLTIVCKINPARPTSIPSTTETTATIVRIGYKLE